MSGTFSPNDDLNDMTLLQLIQSFPDPPIAVFIDPSHFPSRETKPPPRSSVVISPPTPANGPTTHSPSIITSPITSPVTSPLMGVQPLTTSASVPTYNHYNNPNPNPNHHSLSTSPPLHLSHVASTPSNSTLSHSAALPSKATNGLSSPPLQTSQSAGHSALRASAPVFLSTSPADTIDFVSRGCKGELQGQDWQRMNELLTELTPENLSSTLEKCYDNQRQASGKGKFKKKSDDQSYLKVSKHLLDFGYPEGKLCPLDTELTDEIGVTNIGSKKAKFKVSPIPPAPSHILTVTPKDGILKKKQSATITFKLKVRTTTKLRKVVTIEVEGGCKYFVVISLDSDKSVFGVDVDELECVEDNGLRVPAVLVTLRNYLYDHSGLRQEGVFRVQGDEKELQRIKNQLNKGTFTDAIDVNCIASLIKLWYRELPEPILKIPIESLRSIEAEAECVAVYNELPEPNKSLMTWLMDVLADAAMQEAYNKMSARNFAICVAPNLFTSTGTNPADSLFISSKVVHFVSQILNYRLRLKYPR